MRAVFVTVIKYLLTAGDQLYRAIDVRMFQHLKNFFLKIGKQQFHLQFSSEIRSINFSCYY